MSVRQGLCVYGLEPTMCMGMYVCLSELGAGRARDTDLGEGMEKWLQPGTGRETGPMSRPVT